MDVSVECHVNPSGGTDTRFKLPGGTVIYRNLYAISPPPGAIWALMAGADGSGIGQRPEEISFHNVDGDGKADYIWTSAATGKARVWSTTAMGIPC